MSLELDCSVYVLNLVQKCLLFMVGVYIVLSEYASVDVAGKVNRLHPCLSDCITFCI